ncbi:MAG: formylglycine-generating enzyme family protein [Saprospiraceae bacterium]|nr:formylglycine-generating enzyme family protein [Saprospiraceae bacterium]
MNISKKTDFSTLLTRMVMLAGIFLPLFSPRLAAQVPNRMSFQMMVTDTKAAPLFDTDVWLRFRILYDTLDKTVIFEELHTANSGTTGLVRLQIGNGSPVMGTLSGLPWQEGPFFLQTELAYAADGAYSLIGLQEMTSVPFSLYANIAYDLAGGEPVIPEGTQTGDLLYQQEDSLRVLSPGRGGTSLAVSAQGAFAWLDPSLAASPILDVEAQMVWVGGGSYTRGCTADQGGLCDGDESPTQLVTVGDFYIGQYEVTQALWETVMGSNPSTFSGCPECPVEQVSWQEIQQFLGKLNALTGLNYRLPTEAEWEYAARGGQSAAGLPYAGSDDATQVAWYVANAGDSTHVVGQKAANVLGLYDMSGNVYEWCLDWSDEDYNGVMDTSNPIGVETGFNRIRRGGSWKTEARYLRTANRDGLLPTSANSDTGLRLARSAH